MARILLLDDDRALRDVVRMILEEAGHVVNDAPDGRAGVEMYRESPSDIVITDIRMPEKTGNETILELRAEFPDVKIIAMSGGCGRNATSVCHRSVFGGLVSLSSIHSSGWSRPRARVTV